MTSCACHDTFRCDEHAALDVQEALYSELEVLSAKVAEAQRALADAEDRHAGAEYTRRLLAEAVPVASGYFRVHGVIFHLNDVIRWARGTP